LCFSGGGIRSATFCLGVLQALARNPLPKDKYLLDKFDYLSTVSGGGFVGGWFSAWTFWSKGGLTEVMERLKDPRPSKLEPEPDPIFYLRNFSNYLTPRTGLLSADTWTLFATYMRNLLLNWIVLLPLLVAVLVVPRLVLALFDLAGTLTGGAGWPDYARLLYLVVAVPGFACAMFYQGVARPSNLKSLRESSGSSSWSRWWLDHRTQSDFLKLCLGPLVLSAFIFSTFAYCSYLFENGGLAELGIFLAFGTISAAVGWVAYALTVGGWYYWDLLTMLFSAAAGMGLFFLFLNSWNWLDLNLQTNRELYLCLATPLVLIVFLLAATIFVGLATFWTDDEDREYWSRMGAWILAASVAWIAFGAISLFGPQLFTLPGWDKAWSYAGSAIVSFVTAYLGFSDKTPARVDKETAPPSSLAIQRVLPILGAISVVLILAVLAVLSGLLVDAMTYLAAIAFPSELQQDYGGTLVGAFLAIVVAGGIGLAMSEFIDPNKYSLHAMYRNRLIRAYLGAARKSGKRNPNPFTGFDPKDNLPMVCLWRKEPRKLMPFINITLNMVEPVSKKLSWQERKAENFTVTPLHAGSFWVGYRKSSEYAKWNSWRQDGTTPITLGTATAISGAAVSPDMGYNSSPVVSMLLTLFNARLGWWLGNPGMAGNDTYRYSNPGKGAKYMIDEALGRTNDEKPYVYLSDGGHFENLGLYEMVLRRCHTIVVIDADEDRGYTYENLGNAIRKIRTDLGIPIEFPNFSNFRKYNEGGATMYCSVGQIRYSVEDPGKADGSILYVKPTIRGDETGDVLNYERQHREFPHESTADQWFSESQFESYRALGEQEMSKILTEPASSGTDPYTAAKKLLQGL
jgi:hypothetical protein